MNHEPLTKNYLTHMRDIFAEEVYQQMETNPNIWVVTGDLGYKTWDKVRDNFPDRFVNTGVAEQAMIGIGVGLALEGKIPILYSITPFILYRPFEFIRNYVNHEKIPVKLIGVSRGKEYLEEEFTHWSEEDKQVMKIFSNIKPAWPESNNEISELVNKMLEDNNPWYLNLKR